MGTQFASVYNRFLNKITDDMYMELTPQDTIRDLQRLLVDSIPGFEFPRKVLTYEILTRPTTDNTTNIGGFHIELPDGTGYEDASSFTTVLSDEEINILAILMMEGWLQRQVTTIENIRMKYSGTDFKMTSQANHLAKLLTLLKEVQRQSHHMQRLYGRRRVGDNGLIESTWSDFGKNTVLGGNQWAQDSKEEDTHKDIILEGGII